MLMRGPSLVELHAFLAVARTGGFRKAADELCVTQAAVSRAVLRLEETLGVEVLERSGNGVRLTAPGVELRRRVEQPLAELDAAALSLRRRAERLRLRLAVVPSLNLLWLVPRLESFRRAHPEVDLEFRNYVRGDEFQRDDVDLWIRNKQQEQQQWPRHIASQYLMGREMAAVCAPAVARGLRDATQLLASPLLYHSNYPENWGRWAQAAGAALPAGWRGTGFDLVVYLIEAARAGMGTALVPRCLVEEDLRDGRLVMPVPVTVDSRRGYYLCRRRAAAAHPAADVFSEWVRAQAALSAPASPAARRP